MRRAQSTSSGDLSVVPLRLEGGTEADLGRIRLLGGVLALLEDPEEIADANDRGSRGILGTRQDRGHRERGGQC